MFFEATYNPKISAVYKNNHLFLIPITGYGATGYWLKEKPLFGTCHSCGGGNRTGDLVEMPDVL